MINNNNVTNTSVVQKAPGSFDSIKAAASCGFNALCSLFSFSPSVPSEPMTRTVRVLTNPAPEGQPASSVETTAGIAQELSAKLLHASQYKTFKLETREGVKSPTSLTTWEKIKRFFNIGTGQLFRIQQALYIPPLYEKAVIVLCSLSAPSNDTEKAARRTLAASLRTCFNVHKPEQFTKNEEAFLSDVLDSAESEDAPAPKPQVMPRAKPSLSDAIDHVASSPRIALGMAAAASLHSLF